MVMDKKEQDPGIVITQGKKQWGLQFDPEKMEVIVKWRQEVSDPTSESLGDLKWLTWAESCRIPTAVIPFITGLYLASTSAIHSINEAYLKDDLEKLTMSHVQEAMERLNPGGSGLT